jgi:hypothetical protein
MLPSPRAHDHYVIFFIWLMFAVLLAIALGGALLAFRWGGGWWVGLKSVGGQRVFRGCTDCEGCGVMWLSEQPDGTTRRVPIPKGQRVHNRVNEQGDWHPMPSLANVTQCVACSGMAGHWVSGDSYVIRMPFPWPWHKAGWWRIWEQWRNGRIG